MQIYSIQIISLKSRLMILDMIEGIVKRETIMVILYDFHCDLLK
jgi:hypothetical protein